MSTTSAPRRRNSAVSLLALIAMVASLLAIAAPVTSRDRVEPDRATQQTEILPAAAVAPATTIDDGAAADTYPPPVQEPVEPTARLAPLITQRFTAGVPPTGWSSVSNEAGGPVWSDLAGCGEAANYAGAGEVACVSSNKFGAHAFDTELVTEPFSLAGLTSTTLTFVANYQALGSNDFFDVDVSPSGGPWANVLSWNEDHGTFRAKPGENVVIDLSAYDGITDVRVRFHYYDPNAGTDWDWYVQIDNVEITGTPFDCTIGNGILNGSFETGDFRRWCIEDLTPPYDALNVVPSGTMGEWGFYTSTATKGVFLVRHGFDGATTGTISLKQQVTVPATAAVANLTFDWRAAWDFTVGALPTKDRRFDVTVEPAGGGPRLARINIMKTDFATTLTVLDTGQQSATVDLSAFAGSSVLMGLVATIPEPGTGPGNMDIDNVKLTINNRPAVTSPIADIVVPARSPNTTIELSTVFTELDGEAMTFSATSNNPGLVAATVGSPLTLDYQSDTSGTATVTATATDSNGYSNSDSFTVTVTPLGHDIGLVDITQGKWYLRDASTGTVTSFFYGNPVDLPISGDWDGDGDSTPGLYRQSDGFFYARDTNTQGPADNSCFAGDPSDIPLSGDWDGDGDDNLGIYRPTEQKFYLFTTTCTGSPMGAAQIVLTFGNPGDKPVSGDWDGDGIDEIGLHRESTGFFYWRNTLDTGIASGEIFFGDPGDKLVAGDWGVVDAVDSPAIFRPGDLTFYFRHTLTQGIADSQYMFAGAASTWLPVAGVMGLS